MKTVGGVVMAKKEIVDIVYPANKFPWTFHLHAAGAKKIADLLNIQIQKDRPKRLSCSRSYIYCKLLFHSLATYYLMKGK